MQKSIQSKIYKINLPYIHNVNNCIYWDEIKITVCKWLNNNKYYIKKKLNRGDIVDVLSIEKNTINRFMNNGYLIWDGEYFVCLDTTYDKYGHLPKTFLTFQEFPLYYFPFSHTIQHTDISKLNSIETKININCVGYNDYFNYIYCNSFIYDTVLYKIGSKFSLKNKKIITFEYNKYLSEYFDFVVID